VPHSQAHLLCPSLHLWGLGLTKTEAEAGFSLAQSPEWAHKTVEGLTTSAAALPTSPISLAQARPHWTQTWELTPCATAAPLGLWRDWETQAKLHLQFHRMSFADEPGSLHILAACGFGPSPLPAAASQA
jgi:hypothetical protein